MHACVRAWPGVQLERGQNFALAGSVRQDAVSRGWVARMLSFLLLGSVTGPPEGRAAGGEGEKNPVERVALGHSMPQNPTRSTLGWVGLSQLGLRPCPLVRDLAPRLRE